MMAIESHWSCSGLPPREEHASDASGRAGGLDDLAPIVTRLIGSSQRVLLIGPHSEGIADVLRQADCHVTVARISRPPRAQSNGSMLVDPGEMIDFPTSVEGQPYEAALIIDTLTRLRDPLALLRSIIQAISPEGRLVVTVPNAGHGDVRLALWCGASPYTATGAPDTGDLRLFTLASLIDLCEEAGLMLGCLERLERPISTGPKTWERRGVSGALVEAITQDPDARTSRFVAVAYPLARPDLRFFQERMRQLALSLAAARSEVAHLRAAANVPLPGQVVGATRAVEPGPERHAQPDTTADGDVATLARTVRDQDEHIAALTARLDAAGRREIELRSRLIAAHDQLLRRDDEFRFLRRQEPVSHPVTLYHRVRHLYAQLQWVPGIRLPLRVIRYLRWLLRGSHGRR